MKDKQKIFRHIPLYRFLSYCEEHLNADQKKVLDCGAGGNMPPLSLFNSYGYETQGIELSQSQVEKANAYGQLMGQTLNIQEGDMTKLPFEDQTFDCVYSYNSIFHMKKDQIAQSISEMKRVLKRDGMMFVNFLSVDDFRCGDGPHLGNNQYEQMDDEPVIHSYFELDEAETYFENMNILAKERRVLERVHEGEKIKQGFIDYIIKK